MSDITVRSHAVKNTLLALLVLGLACSVHADQPQSDRQIVDHYCAKANTQFDMNTCASAALNDADRQLNDTYQAALKKWAAFPDMIGKLRQSQRTWLAYRDTDLKARFAIEDAEGPNRGTAYPSAYALYKAGLEFERAARLCGYLRGTAYGEQDSASCADLVKHPSVVPNNH